MTLKLIRLEMAEPPIEGRAATREAYMFQAPLTAEGCVDPDAYAVLSSLCHMQRFVGSAAHGHGQLIRIERGWGFCCQAEDDEDAELRLNTESFAMGDEVAVTDASGETRRFRVVSISEVPLRQFGQRA
jgi:hypothetical protein